MPVIRRCADRIPILGVCLGHQAIGEVFGGVVERAPVPVHGKTALIHHDGRGVFAGLAEPARGDPLPLARGAARGTCPRASKISAESEDGLIMGLRHRALPVEGVQFHPESILTASGKALLGNFLDRLGPRAPAAGAAGPARQPGEGQ